MSRCERPGCSQVAEVAFGFQTDPYVIWLDRPDAAVGERRRAGLLCRRHADAMVVPIGWSLDDRRQPVPRLFEPVTPLPRAVPEPVPGEPETPAPPARTARPRKPRKKPAPSGSADPADHASPPPAPAPEATLFDVAPGEVTSAELAPEGPDPMPWRPVFDGRDDLDGLLAAKSPLLARAFRGDERREHRVAE